jgi:hypothetical protein
MRRRGRTAFRQRAGGAPARRCGGAVLGVVLLLGLCGCATPGGMGGPPGAQVDEEVWAIRCITLNTPDRFQLADAYAAALKKVPGLRPNLVQVFHDDDGSAVFYGRYRRDSGPEGAGERYTPSQLGDLEAIRTLRSQGADVWPFLLASMDVLPTYRSPHPEWNLADANGYWTLHVAVFYNTDTMRSRRSAAEQYCALLREQGEEAYYHHAGVRSSVYVGTFPKDAVVEVRRDDPLTGVVNTTWKIVDPRLQAAQQRFPESLHNGYKMYEVSRDPATGAVKQRFPSPSFPVVMPKAQRERDKAGRQ